MGGEFLPQPRKACGDRSAGQAGDFGDLRPRMAFEPQQDDLRIEQRKRAYNAVQASEGVAFCHREAHMTEDEAGAPEYFTGGARLCPVDGPLGRIDPANLDTAIARYPAEFVHSGRPMAISVTQATEIGTVYGLDDLDAVADVARRHGLPLHMDGARFANAAAFLDVSAAEAAGDVDALSFGCVKNGGMSAEAIVFFDSALADVARYRRKRAGHLQSKGRFLAAQLHAMIEDDVWLDNARHANAAAQEIARACGERLMHPVEANELFVRCTAAERDTLRALGFGFYDWGADAARFVTAWNTRDEDARALAQAVAALWTRQARRRASLPRATSPHSCWSA